jgi:hypothetical protein
VKKQFLAVPLGAILISSLVIFSCRKINESTNLGDDLIPPIDNITTFDTILDVQVFNDTFSLLNDSTTYNKNYAHYLGRISNDPFFGETDARIYLQLKPNFFPFFYSNKPDSLHIDSIVLVLDYLETYGDTTVDQTVNVYEIAQSSNFDNDTIIAYDGYRIRDNVIQYAGLLGSRTFKPLVLNDSIKVYKDTTVNQLRIRLDDAFGARLLAYDSTSGPNGAYDSDSAFNSKMKGFALESVSGNALMGFSLTGGNTKLAVYYRDDNGDAPVAQWDTLVTYLPFSPVSASAQYVKRNYSATPVEAVAGQIAPADIAYIQATPGTFARIRIPGLAGLNNRIVHRAELIMEQVYDISDSLFPVPGGLFLDAYDTGEQKYRTVPYDFQFDISGAPNHSAFGAFPYRGKDPNGNSINVWRFNLSRYVQHLVNDTEPYYDLRLTAPIYVEDLYRLGPATNPSVVTPVSLNVTAGKGRVRLHGGGDGSQPNPNPQRMRLRIVYSKI